MIQKLLDKHMEIEKKYEKFIHKHRKKNFKCRQCGETFEDLRKYQGHKEEGCSSEFECDECGKNFKDEEMLKLHKEKWHEKFECDDCEKVFRYEALLEKHREAAHENIELFCHYFNNDKDCPFDENCIYIHEESGNCKYGNNCERTMCMFKHEEFRDIEVESDDGAEDEDDQMSLDGVDIDKISPVLENFKKAVENFEQLLGKYSLKCKVCEFEAKDINGLTMHIKAKHNK